MRGPGRSTQNDNGRRWWLAGGGTIAFAALGIVLAPLLAPRETPKEPPASASDHAPPMAQASKRAPSAGEGSATAPAHPAAGADGPGFDCMIGPKEVIEIRSQVIGRIEAILVERSDRVRAGQIVARLESSVERMAVAVARARAQDASALNSGQASVELGDKRRARARALFQQDALSRQLLDQAEAEAKLAASDLEKAREARRVAALELAQAEAALERRTIRSPVSGYVVERLKAPGEVIDDETMLRIAQVDPLSVEALLPANLFGQVHPGDRAEVVAEAPRNGAREAEIAVVDAVIDGASGTFGVRMLLPNDAQELPAGLRCHVRLLPRVQGVAGGPR